MVDPDSDWVSRAPPYSGYCWTNTSFRLRGFHALWLTFPGDSPIRHYHRIAVLQPRSKRFGLLPVRSPLLRESLLISVPALLRWFTSRSVTSVTYFIQSSGWYCYRITPFGNPGVIGYVLLTPAYRSLSRPSSSYGSLGIRHKPVFA